MPPGPDWIESTVQGGGLFPVPEDGEDGADGLPGKDGRDGVDGKDAELILAGEWRRGRNYSSHSVVTHDGSSYIAKVETKSEPPGKAWQLLAAKGDDGERGDTIAQRGPRGLPGESAPMSTLNMIAAESVQAGMVVRSNNYDDKFVRASAFGRYSVVNILGLAAETANGGHKCKVAVDRLTLKDWSAVLENGSPVLEAGGNYYLSKTLGKITDVQPESGYMYAVGIAISETTMLLRLKDIVRLNTPVLATIDSNAAKGMFARPAENGHIDLAMAELPWPMYAAIGYVMNDFNAGEEASVNINADCLTLLDWSQVTEDTSPVLVEDDEYWLSETVPGKITNVEPENALTIGTAKSATKLSVTLGQAMFALNRAKNCGD